MNRKNLRILSFVVGFIILPLTAYPAEQSASLFNQAGIIGTLILAGLLLIIVSVFMAVRLNDLIKLFHRKRLQTNFEAIKDAIISLDDLQVDDLLEKRKAALKFRVQGDELSGKRLVDDARGLIKNVSTEEYIPMIEEKKSLQLFKTTDPSLSRLVMAFLAAAAFWLLFGTTVGQYLGMKFIWPEMDSVAWLSFGRLRPVHTNTVFWGWASLAMIGLGYFVIARTSSTNIYKTSWGWISFWLINLSVVIGNVCLMVGINNGGGEYREYIWPVATLFAAGLFFTGINFYKTIANRKTSDIYISNWYIIAAVIWTLVLVIIGYLPFYQDGMGETIIQGYYMHQGVGMWFMTFTLGLVYYYLPTALNKPIYSYGLGILAFWTQMLFYTMIGTHHFISVPTRSLQR